MAHRHTVRYIDRDTYHDPLRSRFGLYHKTAKNKEHIVAAVYLLVLDSTGVYRFVCRIADFPAQAKTVDEDGQERRSKSHIRFERVTILFTGGVAFVCSRLLRL
jgi:hypothetical protein